MTTIPAGTPNQAKRWHPLEPLQRRVLGVLVEKAKTTPENYPLSLNTLCNGCNQKSNRSPLMQLEPDQLEETLEELRRLGAVSLVQGVGRIDKYRHLSYEWMGVEKVELAVMAELLLRGAQTVGELRGRAARMEPIKDLAELRPILQSLHAKGLIVYLTPEGRGCVVTHTLYLQEELEKLRREHASEGANVGSPAPAPPTSQSTHATSSSPTSVHRSNHEEPAANLAAELHRLREEVAAVKGELQSVRAEFESTSQQLRRDLDELNRQLGV
jgi:uncharacterized protein YceH (UPF0502 family)